MTEELTTRDAEDLLARYQRALRYFDAEDYAGAARLLTSVVEAEPDSVAVRLLLTRACYHSAQLVRAEEEARQVLKRDPTEAYARLLLGRTLQRQGRDADAQPELRLAAALSGEEWPAGERRLRSAGG